MKEESFTNFHILRCDTCGARGYFHNRACPTCKSKSAGILHEGVFVYFGLPLSIYTLYQFRAKAFLSKVEKFLVFFVAVFGILFFLYDIVTQKLYEYIFTLQFWRSDYEYLWLFWFSLIVFIYLLYLFLQDKKVYEGISFDKKNSLTAVLSWQEALALPKNSQFDLSKALTEDARLSLHKSFLLAHKNNIAQLEALHLFRILIEYPKIQMIFFRLGLTSKMFRDAIDENLKKNDQVVQPKLSEDILSIIFESYIQAYQKRQHYIDVTELFLSTLLYSEVLQKVFFDLNISMKKMKNVIEWIRVQEFLRQRQNAVLKAAKTRNKYGLDRAMTAVSTPYLSSMSEDLTLRAELGYLPECLAREKEIDEIFRVIDAGNQNIVLVGEAGVGKMSLIEGIARRMVEDDVPERFRDKRLIQLSLSSLLAGTTVSGAQERLLRVMNEIARARNIILFINNIDDLIQAGEQAGFDVSKTLAELLRNRSFFVLATSKTLMYNKYIVNSEIGKAFTRVSVEEMSVEQAIEVVEAKVGHTEYRLGVFYAYDAIESSVHYAHRFLHDEFLPSNAIEIMTEAGSFALNSKGKNSIVTKDDVAEVISRKTGIPTKSIGQEESQKLLDLEKALHTKVIGQEMAVDMVANALRRARVDIRSSHRPIANFLFLGPTGVGKTELAKTIAEVYFGNEKHMIRIDMSEYQDTSSLYRLIGQAGQQGTGILTEAVRKEPFSLVLLNELEKADPNVLNLFLQVFDDGHLTDSVGRKIDFTSTIIIATSNAGTSYVNEAKKQGLSDEQIRINLIEGELQKFYRPEFLNRFDGIILFHTLTKEHVKAVANLMLKELAKNLEEKGMELRVEREAIEELLEIGYNPEFGARPMRRAVQDHVENIIAEAILSGKLQRGDRIILCGKSGMRIEKI